MKKLHILILPCLMISSAAHAQWTGMYAGGNVGYSWNSSNMTTEVTNQGSYFADSSAATIDALAKGDPTSSNVVGGAQVGYHWQSDALVIGFELDIDSYATSTTLETTAGYPCCSPSSFNNKQSIETTWMTTLRPHVGYTFANFLIYATGGLAVTDITMTNKFTDDFASGAYEKASHPSTKAGWTAGAGAEYAFNNAWSIGAQYLYTSFGTVSHKGTVTNGVDASELNHEADLSSNILRLNINCHFG